MIPKNIFQSWHSKTVHPSIKSRINLMLEMNPEYNYKLYDDNEIKEFVDLNFPGIISECFNRLNIPVARVDFWRYLILYKYGGVYLDLDSSIDVPLDSFLNENDNALITAENNYDTYVQWALFFNSGHPILKELISNIIYNIRKNKYPNDVLKMTGPQAYSTAIKNYHFKKFGKELDFSRINQETDITFGEKEESYRIYGVDYNNKLTFKTKESMVLYSERLPWRDELKTKELLKPKLNVDDIYICHYSKLKERKQSIIEQLEEECIYSYKFIEKYDKNNWTVNEIEKEYPKVFKEWKTGMTSYSEDAQNSERSLVLKHMLILKDFYASGGKSALVLEDDVLLCDQFVNYCNYFMSQLPNDWDMAWVGSCLNLHEQKIEGKNVYKTDRGSRCTHAFLISRQMVDKVIDSLSNVNLPADHFFNYLIKEFKLNNYWFEPALAIQSMAFCSSISGNYWNEHNVN
jgi:mannosyltransferase OCH1-like enzyme